MKITDKEGYVKSVDRFDLERIGDVDTSDYYVKIRVRNPKRLQPRWFFEIHREGSRERWCDAIEWVDITELLSESGYTLDNRVYDEDVK